MWPRIGNTILGIWLMTAPAVLSYGGSARINDLIIGPIAASVAVIAIWEVTRPLRWVSTLLGIWLLVAPWVLGYDSLAAILNSLASGAIMALLSAARGAITQEFGGGWSALWRSPGE